MTAAAATSDPRATDAAIGVLRDGGNAVDAAVTAALVLYVVEPQSCGIGGDGFIFVHDGGGAPLALDGSGMVPARLTLGALAADGFDSVPSRGAKTATPPGAVALLESALEQFGSITLSDAIEPAFLLARNGFAVRPSLAGAASRAEGSDAAADPVLGPLYWPKGSSVEIGDVVVNAALADALEMIATEGSATLYFGDLADAVVGLMEAKGGYLSSQDLAEHRTTEITPESVDFAGHHMWQFPAPTQGPAVLAALRELGDVGVPDWEAAYGAVRSGMASAGFDPASVSRATPSPAKGDTTFIAVVDHQGMGVSLITSIFGDFGSHLGVPEFGGPIHNRATTFRIAARPLGPGKPPHTTIPGLITHEDGELRYVLGVAGGVMQPQTQVQLALRVLVEGYAPQEAIDLPRFKICFGGDLALEELHPLAETYPAALAKDPGPEGFGAAQMVGWHEGELRAGADRRREGKAVVVA